ADSPDVAPPLDSAETYLLTELVGESKNLANDAGVCQRRNIYSGGALMNNKAILAAAASTLTLAIAVGTPCRAEPQSPSGAAAVADVVVTARKREESLQRVPVAVTAFSGDQMTQSGIREASDLGRFTPSLTTIQANNATSMVVYSLRGQVQGDNSLTN